eukprot:4039022-Pleurochrysis_carterae.AAC.1
MALNASWRVTGSVAIGTGIDDSVRGGTVTRTPISACMAVTGAAAASLPGQIPSCADRGLRRTAEPVMGLRVHDAFNSAVLCVSCKLRDASLSSPLPIVRRASLSSSSRAAWVTRLNWSKTGVGGGGTWMGPDGHEKRLSPGGVA